METKISNYDCYTSGMKKSIKDKLFFEGLIDDSIDTLVDFGCADGELLAQIAADYPEWKLYGVDKDNCMLNKARAKCPSCNYYHSLNAISDDMIDCNKIILNLSSVIHEVYSYSSEVEIENFWRTIFSGQFKYISIRDLMISFASIGDTDINDIRKVVKKSDNTQLLDFVSIWGDLKSKRNLTHYLMKYRYKENWNREVRENYFPITIEQFLNIIPSNYEIIYFNHYILPFTKDKIKEDFGIELRENTHAKFLLRRKDD